MALADAIGFLEAAGAVLGNDVRHPEPTSTTRTSADKANG